MPEGPEIRRAADQVDRALRGQVATRVWFAFPHLRRKAAKLLGARVLRVEPRGKALLTHFEGGLSIYSHNQLYGVWAVARIGRHRPSRRSLRLSIENATHEARLYSASEIEVLRSDALGQHPYLAKLGPDALDPVLTDARLAAHLRDPRFARRRLGMLLLDQGFVAGLGNYLRSEILHVAKLHPSLRLGDLSATELRRLARVTRAITRRAYETGGITNDLRRARRLRASGLSFGKARHHVFTRAGQPCWCCETRIVRGDVAGRQLHWCPRCQPAPS